MELNIIKIYKRLGLVFKGLKMIEKNFFKPKNLKFNRTDSIDNLSRWFPKILLHLEKLHKNDLVGDTAYNLLAVSVFCQQLEFAFNKFKNNFDNFDNFDKAYATLINDFNQRKEKFQPFIEKLKRQFYIRVDWEDHIDNMGKIDVIDKEYGNYIDPETGDYIEGK